MAAYLPGYFNQQFFYNGAVAAGQVLYVYETGTATPKTVYTDQAGTIPYTQPIVLDANGKPKDGPFWILSGECEIRHYTAPTPGGALVNTFTDVAGIGVEVDVLRAGLVNTSDITKGAAWVGFKPNYTGSIGRLLSLKLNEWVSITDFGADATGVTDCATAFNAAVRSAKLVWVTPGTYLLNPRHMLYDDGTYSQVTRVGVSIPSGVTIIGYGATIQSTDTDNDSYSLFASYNTNHVHIKGLTLIGDRDTNSSAGGEYGFGIDFRDVTDCSVEDVESSKMWGDAFYLGVVNASGTGSNRVTYRNIYGHNCRRQGLSITGGQNITVDGYRFINIDGTAPRSGIDIEPNTTAFVRNVRLLNGYTEGCNTPILAHKTENLIIDGLQSVNNAVLMPRLADRVYDALLTGIKTTTGANSNYGFLWQGCNDLRRVRVTDFNLADVALYPFIMDDIAVTAWQDVRISDGDIQIKDAPVFTSTASVQTYGALRFDDIRLTLPAGFSVGDDANLNANQVFSTAGAVWTDSEVDNRGSLTTLVFSVGVHGCRGMIAKKILYARDVLPLNNGWVAAAGYDSPTYLKGQDGVVRLFGTISTGTVADGTIIATLPVGYRPFSPVMCPVVARDGGGAISARAVTVNADGTIVADGALVNNRLGLCGIAFQANEV